MSASPEIGVMAALVQAGMDHRAYAASTDPAARLLDEIVAERVLSVEARNSERRIQRMTGG